MIYKISLCACFVSACAFANTSVFPDPIEAEDHLRFMGNGYVQLSNENGLFGISTEYQNKSFSLGDGNVLSDHDIFTYAIGNDNTTISPVYDWEPPFNYNWIVGGSNYIFNSHETALIGYGNRAENALMYAFGYRNRVESGSGAMIGNDNYLKNMWGVYAMGSRMYATSTGSIDGSVVLLGFNNKSTMNWGPLTADESPLLVLGNGGVPGKFESNALLIKKNGQMTVTHRNFVASSSSDPMPAQPEALVIEGAARVKGVVRVQPGGDLSMGDFTASVP